MTMKTIAAAGFLLFGVCFASQALTNPEGKILNTQGKVEYFATQTPQWQAAKLLQSLFTKDRVHTLAESKAAILFRDETQVRLNANAELVVRSLSDRPGSSSVFELLTGEGWFRTKNPSSDLHVATPSATAAIRGTEINVRIGQDDETILTVVEGQVEFSNDWGSIRVNSGEEASARKGQAPTKRLIVNPEDAVQWVIYYPTSFSWHDLLANSMSDEARAGFLTMESGNPRAALGAFAPLIGTDGWASIGASMAYVALADWENAREVLKEGVPPSLEAEKLTQLAAISLSISDAPSARSFLDAARAMDPNSLRALVLASTVELAQNRKEKARDLARDALSAHPQSVSANMASGEAAQAYFDLTAALQYYNAALSTDPNEIRALVNKARVLFGMGRADAALVSARRASELSADDAQVRSLLGFLRLSTGRRAEASDDFHAAIAADTGFGEPHLGLGLLAFKQGTTDEGLWELLIATLLDPKVSLYQSYLGKAYFQIRRFAEGIAALDSAQRLDPKDPTPRLYKSHFLRDLNRFGDALDELTAAIALNDNRAVYRSRLLLDRDLATKNVSLAEVYRKLGLSAWGVSEALNSLSSDFTNASAHLFLANLYGDLPDRTQAMTSEFLQYILYAPVNQNSFNSFDEYTSLFEQPRFSFSTYAEGAYPEYITLGYPTYFGTGELSTRSGNDFFTHNALLHYKYRVGARPDTPDQFFFGDLQAKLALGLSSDLFLHVDFNLDDYGADQTEIEYYGSGSNSVSVTALNPQVDPNTTNGDRLFDLASGVRHEFAPGFPLTVVAQYQNNAASIMDPDEASLVSGILLDSATNFSWDYFGLTTQQLLSFGPRLQIIVGAEGFYGSRAYKHPVRAYDALTGATVFEWTDRMDSVEWGLHSWVWNEFQLLDALHITAAAFFQRDHGEHLVISQNYDYTQVYPALGITLDLGPAAVIRAAVFQFRTTRMFARVVYPTAVAGFLLDRNEENYTMRTEFHLSLEDKIPPLFLSNHLFFRLIEYPARALILLQSAQSLGLTSDLNWVIWKNLATSVNNQVELTITSPFIELTDLVKTSITFALPVGLTARLSNSFIVQKFLTTNIPELTDSYVDLLDGQIRFDFPGKHGYLTIGVTNILDQRFSMFTEALAITSIYPYRRVIANLSVKL